MIKDKFIKIKIKIKKQLRYYEDIGYKDINLEDDITIPVMKLPKGSHAKITIICDNCGKEREMQFNNYYRTTNGLKNKYYCNNKECINKIRKISINKKYGVDNVFQLYDIKEQIKITNNDKYGVDNPQQNTEIKKKTENTNLERYGYKNVFQNESIKDKIKVTNNDKYGVDYPQQSAYIRSKYSSLHKPSKLENELLTFISTNYKGEIISNKNNIILGYEIDVYLPELNLAFEFNGLYWHSEIYKSNNYHKIKTELCEKNGIRLVHIWEDYWEFKQDIIKSIILNKLGKTPNKIFGRKTEVREITDNKLVKIFLDENHLQGFVGSKVKLGLFFDNELVSLMTFGQLRKTMNSKSKNENDYEMLRFCNKLNTNVLGGASKLFKYFIKKYNPFNVVSYADKSHSNGNLYEQLGFNLIHTTRPNYYYIIGRKRKYRFGFRKDVLVSQGYNPNKSEHEIMLERKIYRIYDAGNYKFNYN